MSRGSSVRSTWQHKLVLTEHTTARPSLHPLQKVSPISPRGRHLTHLFQKHWVFFLTTPVANSTSRPSPTGQLLKIPSHLYTDLGPSQRRKGFWQEGHSGLTETSRDLAKTHIKQDVNKYILEHWSHSVLSNYQSTWWRREWRYIKFFFICSFIHLPMHSLSNYLWAPTMCQALFKVFGVWVLSIDNNKTKIHGWGGLHPNRYAGEKACKAQ